MTRHSFTTTSGWVWDLERAGEGPPVFALHGVGGGSYFFRGLAERLELKYEVTSTNLPSHPAIDSGGDPASMASWAAGVGEIIEASGRAPVTLIGHSLGTILALEVWRRRPHLINAIVFVGGLPEVRDLMRTRLRDRVAAIAVDGMAGWGARISPAIFGSRAREGKPEVVGLFERVLEAHDPARYIRDMEILVGSSAADVVPTVTVPCLSISGTEDAYAPPDFVASFLSRLPQPCEQVLLQGVGHMPFFEVPDEFAAVIAAFLARLAEPAAST